MYILSDIIIYADNIKFKTNRFLVNWWAHLLLVSR